MLTKLLMSKLREAVGTNLGITHHLSLGAALGPPIGTNLGGYLGKQKIGLVFSEKLGTEIGLFLVAGISAKT